MNNDQMTQCHVIGMDRNNTPKSSFLLNSVVVFQRLSANCFAFIAYNFIVLVSLFSATLQQKEKQQYSGQKGYDKTCCMLPSMLLVVKESDIGC